MFFDKQAYEREISSLKERLTKSEERVQFLQNESADARTIVENLILACQSSPTTHEIEQAVSAGISLFRTNQRLDKMAHNQRFKSGFLERENLFYD